MKSLRATLLCILLVATLLAGCINSGTTETQTPTTTAAPNTQAPTTAAPTTAAPTTAAPTTMAPTHPPTTAPPTGTPMDSAWPFVRYNTASTAQTDMDLSSSLSEQWSVRAYPQTTPVVEYGRVYVGVRLLGDEYVFGLCCFDLDTGDLLWSAPNGDPYPTTSTYYSSPAVADGRVVFVRYNNDIVNATCYNAITGQVIWNTSWSDYKQFFSPIIANGLVYLAHGRSMMDGQRPPLGGVMCLNLETGLIQWSQTTADYVGGPVALGSGGVFITTYNYNTGKSGVERMDAATGRRDWTIQLSDASYDVCTPIYEEGYVYVAIGASNTSWDYIGRVYRIDAVNGAVSWTLDLPNSPSDSRQPLIAGSLYIIPTVMNQKTTLTAINTSTGRVAWSQLLDAIYDTFSTNGEYLVCVRNDTFYNPRPPTQEANMSLFDLNLRRMVWNEQYTVPSSRYWETAFTPTIAGGGIVFAVGAKIAWYK